MLASRLLSKIPSCVLAVLTPAVALAASSAASTAILDVDVRPGGP